MQPPVFRVGWPSVNVIREGGSISGLESRQANDQPAKPSVPCMDGYQPHLLLSHRRVYSREGGCGKAENGDQAQDHAGFIPAILSTFTKHIPDPLDGAIGAHGKVACAQRPPDHSCRGRVPAGEKAQVYGDTVREADEGSFYKKGKRRSSAFGSSPFQDPVVSTGPVVYTVRIMTGPTSYSCRDS